MYSTVEKLRTGPIAMPRDHEWTRFVKSDPHFVNPDMPLRRLEDIEYPGKHHPATAEVRAGMLERKSKYLKSYTPGWYVIHGLPCPLLTPAGMSCPLHISTNSSPPIASTRSLLSCLYTCPTRNSARVLNQEVRRTNSLSRVARLDLCIVAIPGYSEPRRTRLCWLGLIASRP